ncbi:MAG: hypothetical protein M0002_06345, partial [Rhodospirillales bacterium]|nr:hypothetical protein [Rhodospirillales bacterium]
MLAAECSGGVIAAIVGMMVSAGVIAALFVAEEGLDLSTIEAPDLAAQGIEEFEHGESLLRRPQGRDGDGGGPERGGGRRRLIHGLPP